MPFSLAPFTLVGATTRTALLSAPLRERFQIIEGLDYYEDQDLAAIVSRTARLLGFPTADDAAEEIGRRCRGTPRIAIRLTRRVRDFAQVSGQEKIGRADADAALVELGVDGAGLDTMDRRILLIMDDLFNGGPVGIDALAASLNEPRDTLEHVYEPFLLQRGFLIRTPRGRQLTGRARRHLKLPEPDSGPPGQSELDL
jgi:Holliday junction DNA helicase RuvB